MKVGIIQQHNTSDITANRNNLIAKIKKLRPKNIIEEGGAIKFKEVGILRRLFDAAVYPVVQLPLDLANFTLKSLRKMPGLKNSKTLKNIYEAGLLAKNREKIFLSEEDYIKK